MSEVLLCHWNSRQAFVTLTLPVCKSSCTKTGVLMICQLNFKIPCFAVFLSDNVRGLSLNLSRIEPL